jgi:murein DD-endopeptidase MepM/ murein hydrolase activator NlpD
MRRVDRVRLEKRRRLILTLGLAFALGALTAGALIWRIDHLAALAAVDAEAEPIAAAAADPSTTDASRHSAPIATSGSSAVDDAARILVRRRLEVPVQGVSRSQLRDSFDEARAGGLRTHEALDIMAPRGTPVRAVEDGRVAKLFRSVAGGLTIYLFDPSEMFTYYYAHLDRYADALREGQTVHRGEVIGYVGSTGNAAEDAPHLHFAIFQMGADRKWWEGTAVNPYGVLR